MLAFIPLVFLRFPLISPESVYFLGLFILRFYSQREIISIIRTTDTHLFVLSDDYLRLSVSIILSYEYVVTYRRFISPAHSVL